MRKTIAIIGEGITEKYYIESLKGISPFVIMPRELGLKASNLMQLEKNIVKSISDGFDEVYCLIDMDGKATGKAKEDYLQLKNKYHETTFSKKSKGTKSKVCFIETERCIELWFLYYFTPNPVTRKFNNYNELEKALRKFRPNYEKSEKYFKSVSNVHRNFESNSPAGSLANACKNAKMSVESNLSENRGHSYSEMHLLISALELL